MRDTFAEERWRFARAHLYIQAAFSCVALAGLMAAHIVDGDRLGFVAAVASAFFAYVVSALEAWSVAMPEAVRKRGAGMSAFCRIAAHMFALFSVILTFN